MIIEGTEEQVAAMFTALAKARANFKEVKKDADGQEKGGKFKYAPLKNLVDATAPALAAEGLVVLQPFSIDMSNPEHSGMGRLTTLLLHSGGGRMSDESVFFLEAGIKQIGGQSTYMARYAYQRMLVLDGEDDADNHDTMPKGQPVKKPRTEKQDDAIIKMAGELGIDLPDLNDLCIKVTGSRPEDAGFEDAGKLIQHLGGLLAKAKGVKHET